MISENPYVGFSNCILVAKTLYVGYLECRQEFKLLTISSTNYCTVQVRNRLIIPHKGSVFRSSHWRFFSELIRLTWCGWRMFCRRI